MKRPELAAECGSCLALCCVVFSFSRADGFAHEKPAGTPCSFLGRDCRCSIYDERPARGMSGCVSYECYGAGQAASQRFRHESADVRVQAFLVLRELHELRWMLREAALLCPGLAPGLRAHEDFLDKQCQQSAAELAGVGLSPLVEQTHDLLREVGRALGGRAGLLRAETRRLRSG